MTTQKQPNPYIKVTQIANQIHKISGTKRAALLMIALGEKNAIQVAKHLPSDDLAAIFSEVARIKKLSPDEKQQVLDDFFNDMQQGKFDSQQGGEQFAREILRQAFGESKADSILASFSDQNTKKYFRRIEQSDPNLVCQILQNEHPQIVCITIAHLNPRFAAQILRKFPPQLSSSIALRMAKLDKSNPESVIQIAHRLAEKIKNSQPKQDLFQAGGVNAIVDILNHSSGKIEKSILDQMNDQDPELANTIRNSMVTFDHLLQLSRHELRKVMNMINMDAEIAMALRGLPDEDKRYFLSNVSRNRARDIMDLMRVDHPVHLTKIEKARNNILNIAKELDQSGEIILRKDEEEWIE